jgi:hypothetical protein
VTTSDGRLIGPFNSFLLHPPVASACLQFWSAVQSNTSLSPRVREVVMWGIRPIRVCWPRRWARWHAAWRGSKPPVARGVRGPGTGAARRVGGSAGPFDRLQAAVAW